MYTKHMTVEGHTEKTASDDGKKVETLHMEFTNGSLQQLKDLAKFFDVKDNDPTEVVKLGISFLQNAKDKFDEKAESES